MTFKDVIHRMSDSQAAKTPDMSGYVKRTDVAKTQGDTWDSKFKITFVERPNGSDPDSTSQYEYVYTITGGVTVVTTSATMVLDAQLMAAMSSAAWSIATLSEFENARNGTTRW